MSKLLFLLVFISMVPVVQAQTTDTSLFSSVNAVDGNADSSSEFFSMHEKIAASAWTKIRLVTKARKNITLNSFLNDPEKLYPDHVLADMDGDGKKELVISIFTGGAHCCDEISIFRDMGAGKYVQTARLFAGHSMITPTKEIIYTLYEPFGYFFTCYACGLSDTSDTAPIDIRAVTLVYKDNRIQVKPGDPELRSAILDNLGKLAEMPYEELDAEIPMDNGLRKEFAMNLAVYYFSFGKKLPDTKALFDRFYKFPDAAKVWTAFTKQLRALRSDSDL
jgi:hypothetical protein